MDPGYISRLLRGMVKNAPSAVIIKKLADAAANEVKVQDLLAAAGYIDLWPGGTYGGCSYSSGPEPRHRWERVIEEAAKYDISPEEALEFISSLGKSMARIRKKDD